VGVEDVVALLVGARSRDRQVLGEYDANDLATLNRVPDADPPPTAGAALASRLDVTAGVDEVVSAAVMVEDRAGPVDGPALDQAGGIEAPIPPGREVATGRPLVVAAQLDRLADQGARLGDRQLAPVDPADGAVGEEGAEGPVEESEVRERLLQGEGWRPGLRR